jgi:hypothetical protein
MSIERIEPVQDIESKLSPMQEIVSKKLFQHAVAASDVYPSKGIPQYPLMKAEQMVDYLDSEDVSSVLPQKFPFRADFHIAALEATQRLEKMADNRRTVYYEEASKWFMLARRSPHKLQAPKPVLLPEQIANLPDITHAEQE